VDLLRKLPLDASPVIERCRRWRGGAAALAARLAEGGRARI
jgi:hypothetical protein